MCRVFTAGCIVYYIILIYTGWVIITSCWHYYKALTKNLSSFPVFVILWLHIPPVWLQWQPAPGVRLFTILTCIPKNRKVYTAALFEFLIHLWERFLWHCKLNIRRNIPPESPIQQVFLISKFPQFPFFNYPPHPYLCGLNNNPSY